MKKILISIIFTLFIVSCEKSNLELDKEGKIKIKYAYSNSTDTTLNEYTTYSYDSEWNLIKELTSKYPKPIYRSYKYDYNDNGELINKKHYYKLGENYPDQTESSFDLIQDFIYVYSNNKIVEIEYDNAELIDSTVNIYSSGLLINENHYDFFNQTEWYKTYEYDANGNLIKETTLPDGSYCVYFYENSKLQKTLNYDSNDSLLSETVLKYTEIDDKEIIETFIGGVISEKATKRNGNIIEFLKYHPLYDGVEWYYHINEYY